MKSSWRSHAGIALTLCLLLLFTASAVGQERTGSIAGVVKDSTGAVVPDVTVSLRNNDTNRLVTTRTRGDGAYSAADLEPGRYSVTIERQGFTRFEAPDVQVFVGRTSTVDAALRVAGGQETLEVVETTPAIDTTSTMVAHNVTLEELNLLPKGRNSFGIANLAPSVNTGQIEGGFQINGASAAENAYYVDGVATSSIIDGSARQTATFDYIQEVQVKTTGLDAEYGGALGGVVSAITRSGGNSYHGEMHFLYYGNKLAAGPVRRLTLDPQAAPGVTPAVSYFQDGKFRRDNYEFGGSLGGPILRDRLWFFTAASPRWLTQRNDYEFTDGAGTMSRSFHQMNWFTKLSYNPTDRIRTNFSWLYTPQYLTGSLFAYDGYGSNKSARDRASAAGSATRGYNQPENSLTGQVDITLTDTSLLNLKAGRYRLNYKEVGIPYQWSTRWSAPSIGIAGVPANLQLPQGFATPSAAQVVHDLTTRTYVQADFSQIVNFGGQHSFRFGVGTQKNINNVDDPGVGPLGRVSLFWGQSFQGQTGTYGYYTVDDFATRGTAGANITNIYVQDTWKVMRRLSVNAGVRFEKETIPSFRPDVQKYAFQFGFGDKVAPRLGASFDLLGNGKVKISGGWGRYFDWTKFDLSRGTFGGDLWHVFYRTLNTLDVYNINLNNMPGTNIWAGGAAPFRDRRIPGFDLLDPDVKPMSVDTLHAGVEWELHKSFVFTGRYVRSNLNRTIEDLGALDSDGNEVYRYGNPGEGANRVGPSSGGTCVIDTGGTCGFPIPKPVRTYDAMELSLARRFASGWFGSLSYVYSRLYGNYAGLQSTDEIRPPGLGGVFGGNQAFAGQIFRPGGNANRYFDLDEALYDANGNLGLFGRLPTDRPHVMKFYGAKQFRFGTEVGGFFRLMSGTPVTTQAVTHNQIPMYVEGRGDAGRTPVFSQTDLQIAHEFKLGSENKRLRFEMNMINLFNQKTSMFTWDRYNREEFSDANGLDLSGTDLSQGFDWKAMLAATEAGSGAGRTLDPRYGKAGIFNPGFDARFAVKFSF